jgi:hypothetical protein
MFYPNSGHPFGADFATPITDGEILPDAGTPAPKEHENNVMSDSGWGQLEKVSP